MLTTEILNAWGPSQHRRTMQLHKLYTYKACPVLSHKKIKMKFIRRQL